MQQNTRPAPNPPSAWPTHLNPYDPGPHPVRVVHGVELHPYDWTPSRVKSWVAIGRGRYLGVISQPRSGDRFQAIANTGASTFTKSIDAAAGFLSRPSRSRLA